VWAPICLTLIRLLQGFSLGGEMSGSMTYVTEHASQQHRGLAACTSFLSMVLGILLGLLVASICVYGLDDAELKAWGWRLPFLFGIFTCAVGVYIRTKLDESALYKAARDSGGISKTPLHDVIKLHKRELFVSMGIVVSVTIPFYTLTVFMLNYMSGVLHYKIEEALISNALALLVLVFFIPISAFVSDKIGRKPVLLCGVFGFIFFSYPAFYLLEQPDWQKAVIAQMFFAVWVGIYLGAAAAAMVEMFPTRVRFTGLAISYNLCIAIFGATAPIIMTWLATSLGDLVVSSWYVIGGAVVTLIALFFYREKRYAELL
jgi:MHS family proline/betaine transporter-like MFS transporter